jgi:hypothetical protein
VLKTLQGWQLYALLFCALGIPIGWRMCVASSAAPRRDPQPRNAEMLLPDDVFDGGPREETPHDLLVADERDLYLARGADHTVLAFPKAGGPGKVLATLEQPALGMTFHAGSLWITSGGMVERIPASGGTPVVIARALSRPGAIATDGEAVYVVDAEEGDAGLMRKSTLLRFPAKGGASTLLARSDGEVDTLALDDTSLYWADRLDGAIRSVPKAGGAARTLASERGSPEKLTLRNGALYWVERRSESIWTMPVAGTTPLQFTQDFAGFANLVVDGRGVWWSNEAAVDGAFRVLVALKPGEELAASPPVAAIDALASDGQDLFWARDGDVSRVGRADAGDSSPAR